MKPLIFLDTETCGLGVTDPIWEVAVIRRDDEGTSSRTVFQVRHNPKAALELPEWFRADHDARYVFKDALKRTEAAELVRGLLAPNSEGKAVIVGAAPDFDVTRISRQLLDDLPSGDLWDHHLIDVTTLALGARGFGARVRRVTLPWSLDNACRAYGVDPKGGERHSAMFDAELVEDLFDAVTVGAYRIDR